MKTRVVIVEMLKELSRAPIPCHQGTGRDRTAINRLRLFPAAPSRDLSMDASGPGIHLEGKMKNHLPFVHQGAGGWTTLLTPGRRRTSIRPKTAASAPLQTDIDQTCWLLRSDHLVLCGIPPTGGPVRLPSMPCRTFPAWSSRGLLGRASAARCMQTA